MALVDIKNLEGRTVGQVDLADDVFARRINPHLLHEVTRWYLRSQRAGTHKTKGRGEVSGAGRKPWRQKGTGRARVGSIRSSIWRKGGTVHGPQPRSYAYALPKKMILGALRSALSAKLAEQKLTVVEGWPLETHKTGKFRQTLARLEGDTRTFLLVEPEGNRNLELASRNLEGVKLVTPKALQAYDLLKHDRLMLSKDTALQLGRTLGSATTGLAAEGSAAGAAPAASKPVTAGKPRAAKAAAAPKKAKSGAAKKPRAKKPAVAGKPKAPKAKE
jgi:large subunit ribosomal protein L4